MTAPAIAYDLPGAAEAVHCSVTLLRAAIHSGDLKAKRVGRKYLIGATELRAWFEQLQDA